MQRISKIENGSATLFFYGQDHKLLEIKSPTATADFIYLNDEPLAIVQGSNVYYFINDTNHTPKYLTDQSNNTQWQADIKPFKVKELTTHISQPLRFPGQVNDATTGLIYNHARDYLPTLGRFLQPDPAGLNGSYNNLFSYAGQNPVNVIDPSGRCIEDLCIVEGTIAVGVVGSAISAIIAHYNENAAQEVAEETQASKDGEVCASDGPGQYKPAPNGIPGIPGLKPSKRKTPVQGGGRLRKRWKDDKGNTYEWDYQHGTVEKYNKRGKHLGEFDPKTGKQTKPANKNRNVEP